MFYILQTELPKQRKERNKQSEIYAILSPLVSCYLSLDLISLFLFFSTAFLTPPHKMPQTRFYCKESREDI